MDLFLAALSTTMASVGVSMVLVRAYKDPDLVRRHELESLRAQIEQQTALLLGELRYLRERLDR